jgi:hypothetical protein
LTCRVRDFAEFHQILFLEFPWIWRIKEKIIEKPRSVNLLFGSLETKTHRIPEKWRGIQIIVRLEEGT